MEPVWRLVARSCNTLLPSRSSGQFNSPQRTRNASARLGPYAHLMPTGCLPPHRHLPAQDSLAIIPSTCDLKRRCRPRMARSRRGSGARRRAASFRRCWQICSCIMLLTFGWIAICRACGFAVTPTTRSFTAKARRRRNSFYGELTNASDSAGSNCKPDTIRQRGRSPANSLRRQPQVASGRAKRSQDMPRCALAESLPQRARAFEARGGCFRLRRRWCVGRWLNRPESRA